MNMYHGRSSIIVAKTFGKHGTRAMYVLYVSWVPGTAETWLVAKNNGRCVAYVEIIHY